jgi:biotin operon repressor
LLVTIWKKLRGKGLPTAAYRADYYRLVQGFRFSKLAVREP